VDYSAAADALTYCPENFDEFFNQRRRWGPSTIANIWDLLADFKNTVLINDNISQVRILKATRMSWAFSDDNIAYHLTAR
jgi:chitin synthase